MLFGLKNQINKKHVEKNFGKYKRLREKKTLYVFIVFSLLMITLIVFLHDIHIIFKMPINICKNYNNMKKMDNA